MELSSGPVARRCWRLRSRRGDVPDSSSRHVLPRVGGGCVWEIRFIECSAEVLEGRMIRSRMGPSKPESGTRNLRIGCGMPLTWAAATLTLDTPAGSLRLKKFRAGSGIGVRALPTPGRPQPPPRPTPWTSPRASRTDARSDGRRTPHALARTDGPPRHTALEPLGALLRDRPGGAAVPPGVEPVGRNEELGASAGDAARMAQSAGNRRRRTHLQHRVVERHVLLMTLACDGDRPLRPWCPRSCVH